MIKKSLTALSIAAAATAVALAVNVWLSKPGFGR